MNSQNGPKLFDCSGVGLKRCGNGQGVQSNPGDSRLYCDDFDLVGFLDSYFGENAPKDDPKDDPKGDISTADDLSSDSYDDLDYDSGYKSDGWGCEPGGNDPLGVYKSATSDGPQEALAFSDVFSPR